MNRVHKTECDFFAVMRKFKLNRRMLAELLEVNKETLKNWIKEEKIPTKHLNALHTITHQRAAEIQKWAYCDLDELCDDLCVSYAECADLLVASAPNLTTWRKRQRVPRNRLHLVQKLQCQIENNSY